MLSGERANRFGSESGTLVLSKRWAHHSASSGYHQLARYLGQEIPLLDLQSRSSYWIPGRFAIRMVRRSGVELYDYQAFYDEWAACRMLARAPRGTLCHVLYGDESFRYLGLIRRLKRVRLVATYHQPPEHLESALSYTRHLSDLDAVILVGSNQAPYFRPLIGADRVHVVPHGVDTDIFRPADPPPVPGPPTVLFVGMHKRDFGVLRDVVGSLGGIRPDLQFEIVTDERNRGDFADLPGVRFRSGVPEAELIRLYQESRILLQPMCDCTANNAILEGMACGLPVVATDVGAAADYVDRASGVLVKPGDSAEMCRAVLRLLDDPSARERLSAGARHRAEELSWPAIASRIRTIYSELE